MREPGANRLVGDGDDVTTSLGTYSGWVWNLHLAGRHALAMAAGGLTGGQMVYRAISASTSFASSYTTLDLPYSSVSLAALSPDGSMLAYTDTSINSVVVRYPTAGHYTVGDLTVTRPLPPGFVGDELRLDRRRREPRRRPGRRDRRPPPLGRRARRELRDRR